MAPPVDPSPIHRSPQPVDAELSRLQRAWATSEPRMASFGQVCAAPAPATTEPVHLLLAIAWSRPAPSLSVVGELITGYEP